VKLTLNASLGREDAKYVELSQEVAVEGATVDVKAERAEYLIKKGWAAEAKAAEPFKADPSKAAKIEGVPASGKPANA